MQINQANLSELYKGYRVLYMEAYQAGAPVWPQLALEVPSSAKIEVHAWLGAVPGMRRLLTEVQIQNLAAHRYSIENYEWEDTVAVKEADIEQDTYGVYNPLFSAMGSAASQHPDELVAGLLTGGFTTKCYTGKNFFDANHEPQVGGTKFSNKGTKKLSADNFATARENIKSRLNAAGRPMNLGKKLLLVVSPKNENLGRQILQADFIQATAKNVAGSENVGTTAVTNVNKGTADLLVWPQLAANPDAWFLLEVGMAIKPLLHQVNKKPVLTALTTPTSDHVFKKHEYLFQGYGRYNAGYGLPELAYGSTGADPA